MIDTLIIANDAREAEVLKQMIENANSSFKVAEILSSVREAKIWLTSNNVVHLIFCDIELRDGLGFEIFQGVPAAPVIYFTTYDGYALEAFENSGIDYLIKPIDERKLENSLRKFLQLKNLFGEEGSLIQPRPVKVGFPKFNSYKTSLLVYFQDKIIPVNMDQMDFIYYNNYIVTVHAQGAHYETRDTLNNIITTLNPRDFFRANRQFIIHRKAVTNIQQYFGRKLLVGMSAPTPEPVIISKANASDFLKWMEGLNIEEARFAISLDDARFSA
ncbi:LytR/AlgR family response regulator transcription factor [Dyadobacter bucti]|jgi:two-component system response regulator LytT|uniref:LytR/AlgR family response regulator transcription factor n=1 Tax=Dyadobacter bucti TaxID=2572203 RepID=UPI001109C799|nr:LytTR family DNA-binding domain-containing protein [Dyadobacter bucti]